MSQSRRFTFLGNAAGLFVMQGMNYLIPFITLPYLTRILGAEQYGVLSTVQNFAAYAVIAIDFGFNLSATKEIAQLNAESKKGSIEKVFTHVMAAKTLIFLIALVVILLILANVTQYQALILPFCFTIPQLIGTVMLPVWFYQGIEKVYVVSITVTVAKLLTLPLVFIFVRDYQDVNQAALAMALPWLLGGIAGLFMAFRHGIGKNLFGNLSITAVIDKIKASTLLFIGTTAVTLYTMCAPILLSLLSTYEQAGYFAAADKLRGGVLGLLLVLAQIIYPRVNALLATDPQAFWRYNRKLLLATVGVGAVTALLFYLILPLLAGPLLGQQFNHLGTLLKLLAPLMLLVPIAMVLSNCMLLPMGKNRTFAVLCLITAVIYLVCAVIFCGRYGAEGAAVAILIAEILNLVMLFVVCAQQGYFRKLLQKSTN